MLLNTLNIVYLLVSIAMVGFILLQRGPGATAGSGFGAGASATVFGARGSANFLSRSTAVLAAMFFLLSLGMAVYVSRNLGAGDSATQDLGVMSGVATTTNDEGAVLEPAAESTVISESSDGGATATVSQTMEPAATDSESGVVEEAATVPEEAAATPKDDTSGQ